MSLKVILIGYPGSQKIVQASMYLAYKYLPTPPKSPMGFEFWYLNHKGPLTDWAWYLETFLLTLDDKYVIFSLDDYLIADHINMAEFNLALSAMGGEVVCAKLCECTPEENEEYPVTTQWTIWDRKYLIALLNHPDIRNPWQFEIVGSRVSDKKVIHRPCLKYFTNSSISSRWEGIRLDGLNEDDYNYIISNLLPLETTYHTDKGSGRISKPLINF